MKRALKLVENFGSRVFKCRVTENLKPALNRTRKP
nr:MAG TPA: hypothetical protein [Caudoviricetes sp.]